MIKTAIEKVINFQNLSELEMAEVMEEIMEGEATP
ncbi:MAG: anthranilate phosphoribosyltransferase, partial [Desulfobacterota bacterium]|nr:anthranilate phosphoribosyltransferase [Thermodesulfobacteriota bacterium]